MCVFFLPHAREIVVADAQSESTVAKYQGTAIAEERAASTS
jgi:hypothetical protein